MSKEQEVADHKVAGAEAAAPGGVRAESVELTPLGTWLHHKGLPPLLVHGWPFTFPWLLAPPPPQGAQPPSLLGSSRSLPLLPTHVL